MEKKIQIPAPKLPEEEQLPAELVYPSEEDIYNRAEKTLLDEDDLPVIKGKLKDHSLDEGLDVPGAELDDEDEVLGEEDEENNYYSLGGDNHSDLDEN